MGELGLGLVPEERSSSCYGWYLMDENRAFEGICPKPRWGTAKHSNYFSLG